MKTILKIVLTLLIIVGIAEPSFAMYPPENHPRYMKDFNYIERSSCNSVAMIPYTGEILYQCPSGESFWSEVLVPTKKSPLFMYFKNRAKNDDEIAAVAASSAAVSSSSF